VGSLPLSALCTDLSINLSREEGMDDGSITGDNILQWGVIIVCVHACALQPYLHCREGIGIQRGEKGGKGGLRGLLEI